MTVRPAMVDDLPAMVDLLARVAAEGRWLGTEAPFDRQDRLHQFRHTLDADDHAMWIAVAGSELVGQLSIELRSYGVAELGMHVAAPWRRRGVGSALLAPAIEWARGAGSHKVMLQLWPHNRAAAALYRKFGFVEEGRLRRHYRRRNGELWDALLMGLVLDEESPGGPIDHGDPDDGYPDGGDPTADDDPTGSIPRSR